VHRQTVDENWVFWRPIMEGKLSFERAETMTLDELLEVNAAIDSYAQRLKEARGG